MADRLRVAHRSDIHLSGGTDDRARVAFAHARAAMRRRDPDLMLLAGDLFDANSVPDDAVAREMERLARSATCAVVGLPFGQPSRLAIHPGH